MASVLNRQGCDDTIGAGRGEGYRELLKTRLRLLLPSLPGNRLAHIRTVGRSTEPSPAAPSTSRTQSLSLRTSGQRLSRPAWSCPQTQTASAMRVQHLTALRTHQINQQVNAILATDEVKAQLRAAGMVVAPDTPEQFKQIIADEIKLHAEMVKEAGLLPQ